MQRSVLGVLLTLAACDAPRPAGRPPDETRGSRVDVYVGCADPGAREVALELEAVELRTDTGETVALELANGRLVSGELQHRQRFAGGIVPPGTYGALVLRIARAELAGPGGTVALRLVPQPEGAAEEPLVHELPLRTRVGRQDAVTLFLDWRVDESLVGGADFAPSFVLATERPRVSLGLLYVADETAGAVLAVERSSGEVVSTFKVGAGPRALALARDRRRLFVANAGDGSLSELDVQQGGVTGTLPFGLSAGTRDVVLAERQRTIAVAQRDLDQVSLVDAGGLARLLDVPVGRAPLRVAASGELGRLFVADSGADAVEVIDLVGRVVVARVPVEARPADVALDRRERELFVAHATSPNLLVLDARTLALSATIHVGPDATAVLADRRRDRIYVARSRPAEVVMIDRQLASVLRRIPVSGRIEALAQPVDGGEVYGAAPELGALIAIDVVLGKELPPLRCGGRPVDVVVAD